MIIVEFDIPIFKEYFKFMDNHIGRGIFIMFLSCVIPTITLLATLSEWIMYITSFIYLIAGVMYLILFCYERGKSDNKSLSNSLNDNANDV